MTESILDSMMMQQKGKSRAINAENRTGEKGKAAMAASDLGPSRKGSPCLFEVKPGETVVLGEIQGAGVINHIWMTITDKTSEKDVFVLRDMVLRMYWDGEKEPSVECPLGDFFCCGFGRECEVNSIPIAVAPLRGMNCYFKMPFRKSAKITLENQHSNTIPNVFYQIDYALYDEMPENISYFHAQWRRKKITTIQDDYVILDGVEGKGHYVGTYMALSTLERYWWGEGEVKFYLDGDEAYPTLCSTGTEDYFGGAWSFADWDEKGKTYEKTFCRPYMGYPYYSAHDTSVFSQYHNDECPPMRGFYRWHLPDPIMFDENLKVTIQQIGAGHRGMFERQDDVSTVAYWYQTEPHQSFQPLMKKEDRWPR